MPCKSFVCSWLGDQNNTFPEWMRPDKCGVLMQPNNTKNGYAYIAVYECGKKIDSSVLNWLILYTLGGGQNISVQVGGGWSHYGTQEFLKDINS